MNGSDVGAAASSTAAVAGSLLAPAPALLQCASAFFLGAALFSDVLLIRACLSLAYAALLAHNLVHSVDMGAWALDGILWALVTGAFHSLAFYTLAHEEVGSAPALPTDDDRALWAYVHRRTGTAPALPPPPPAQS